MTRYAVFFAPLACCLRPGLVLAQDAKPGTFGGKTARDAAMAIAPPDWKARWIAATASAPKTSPTDDARSLGYHSGIAKSQDTVKCVQVDPGEARPIDKVILQPCDYVDVKGFGFPVRSGEHRGEVTREKSLR